MQDLPPYPRIQKGLTLYVVGDLHGRSDLLARLHDSIDAHALSAGGTSMEIYLGDYIDRGRDPAGTISRLLARSPAKNVFALRGNHEATFQHFMAGGVDPAAWRAIGGYETMLSYGIDLRHLEGAPREEWIQAVRAAVPPEHIAFLASLSNGSPFQGYFFCHAGIRPGIPLAQQQPTDLLWIRDEFLNDSRDHGAVIVHGHTPHSEPEFRANRINLDTGAYMTGRLTCLVIDEHGPRLLEDAMRAEA